MVPSHFQHVARAGNGNIERFQWIGPIIVRTGDAGGVHDVMHRPVNLQRLDDVVLDELHAFSFAGFCAEFAGGDEIVNSDQFARLLEHTPIQVRKHFGEIPAQEPAAAGQHDGLAGKRLGGRAEILDDFGDVRFKNEAHTILTVGTGTMKCPAKPLFLAMMLSAKFQARMTR